MIRTVCVVIRFSLFYFGVISESKRISPSKKHRFRTREAGQNCPKCGIIMKHYKGKLVNHKIHYDAVTVGHILPLALGGSHSKWQIQPECKICNAAHGAVLAELIHQYGKSKWDVPYFILLKFVVYSAGQIKSTSFNKFENEFQRHLFRLKERAGLID